MRGLILGAATGYRWPQLAPFVTSWRQHAPGAALVLLVEPTLDAGTRARLRAAGVALHAVRRPLPARSRRLRRWLRSAPAEALRARLVRPLAAVERVRASQLLRWHRLLLWRAHIACARHLHALHVLAAYRPRPTHVLLCDTRDVLFQADPFAAAPAEGLLCALEAPQSTLLSEPWNRAWLDQLYGRAAWAHLGGCRVSCAGTTLGTREAVRAYLVRLSAELVRLAPRLGDGLVDQAAHNVLLHGGRLGRVAFSETGRGPIATLHAVDPATLRWDAAGRLLDERGAPIAVVHQYDRLPPRA